MLRFAYYRLALLAALLWGGGCQRSATLPGDGGEFIRFQDHAPANATVRPEDLLTIRLQSAAGQTATLKDYCGERPVVLVITRGLVGSATPDEEGNYARSLCIYCSTQISRLIANYPKFQQRGAEVVVVFPVAREADRGEVQTFAARVQGPGRKVEDSPFPILIDVDLQAVDALGIRADLSKPATYIIDAAGQVRYAYVGQTPSDRPSIEALLKQLDALTATQPS